MIFMSHEARTFFAERVHMPLFSLNPFAELEYLDNRKETSSAPVFA
jgi:hypothetical protein